MKPFVKWAGGKRQILERIGNFINGSLDGRSINSITYFEPFLGGGAVLFDILPEKACVNDLNSDLINAYRVIKSKDYQQLIEELREYQIRYNNEDRDELYYNTRQLDRIPAVWNRMTNVQKAARMIFLNRTCYNGLYRVNSSGYFNTPMGRYRNPLICDEKNLSEIHDYLSSNKITILNGSYEDCIKKAKDGDIIYVDPPYDYEDDDGFTKYQMSGFTFDDFVRLKKACDAALRKGAYVIISNNATERVLRLFYDDPNYQVFSYETNKFETLRSINCKGDSRKNGYEAIFWGIPYSIPFPQANDVNKVIALTQLTEDQIKDKKYLAENVLNVSERQVAYYCAALKFFKYLNNHDEYTEELLKIKDSKEDVVKNMIEQLNNNDDYRYVVDNNIYNNTEEIAKYLIFKYKKLGKTTALRRASTIKSWVEWVIENNKKTHD